MKHHSILAIGAIATALLAPTAHAQTKKELVQKLIQLQQPGIEAMARSLAETPAAQMLQAAGVALQNRVPADKREAVARSIEADAKKYADEAVPLLRDRAMKLAPSTMGAELEQRFTDAELKQLVAFLESPAVKKFQQALPEMQKVLVQKLVEDSRSTIEPKLKTLEGSITQQLTAAAGSGAGAGAGTGIGPGVGTGIGPGTGAVPLGGPPLGSPSSGGASSGAAPRK